MKYFNGEITVNLADVYDLCPVDGRKSFYGKAKVYCMKDGSQYLKSYNTIVMKRDADGTLHRMWDGWSATTGRHVAAFCGTCIDGHYPGKADWDKMPVEHA